MTLRRSVPSLAMTAVLIVAAVVSLGVPNWGLAQQFLLGSYPSTQAALAVAGMLCWVIILGIGALTVGFSIRQGTDVQLVQRRWTRATMFVTAGVIVLGIGALHHSAPGYSMCCGSQAPHIVEAQKLASS